MNRLLPLSLLVLAAQFGVQANPVMGTDVLRYWYTSDDGDGPSRSAWSRHLKISWDNVNGDYLDAAGLPQGGVPFAQASVTSVGPLSIALDKPQAFRKGILLRLSGKSNPHLSFAGRLSATPPTLTVKRSDGIEKIVPALSLAAWSMSSHRGFDTRQSARLNAGEGSVMVLFDIPSDAVSATLNLNVVAKNNHAGTLSLFALYPPGVFYPREHAAVPGIAATVANETALKTHPAVIRAGDFDLRHKSLFDGISQSENVSKEYLPDPLDPKRIIYRSMFKQRDGSADADQNWRGSLSLTLGTMLANKADPLLPTANVTKELFGRMCFKMEADWLARNDANKMALGWDLRLGYGSRPTRLLAADHRQRRHSWHRVETVAHQQGRIEAVGVPGPQHSHGSRTWRRSIPRTRMMRCARSPPTPTTWTSSISTAPASAGATQSSSAIAGTASSSKSRSTRYAR